MTKQNDRIEKINDKLIEVANDVTWLKKFFWVIAVASVGGWVTSFLNLTGKILAK